MNWFVFLLLAATFLISPYFKGLYFNTSFYGISVLISALFLMLLVNLLSKKDTYVIKKTWPIFLLPLTYLPPFFTSASPKGEWDLLLQWCTFSFFFVLLYWVSRVNTIKAYVPVFFQLTGGWIAVYTILAYYDVFNYHGAFLAGRFASVFQYPNTFGMVMAVFALFSLIMLTKASQKWTEILLYSIPIIPFIVCFVQSYSRGMFLIFPVIWLVALVVMDIQKQLKFIILSLAAFSLSLLEVKYMAPGIGHSLTGLGTLAFLILLFTVIVYLITHKKAPSQKLNLLSKKRMANFIIPILFIVVGGLGLLDIKNEGLLFQQLPNKLQERVSSVDTNAATAQERMIFLGDGLKMSKDSPLYGFGGKSWASLNKKYQEMPYLSNKAHNGYMEWILDTGWLGLIIFIGVWAFFLLQISKAAIKEKENTSQLAVFVSVIGIFLHSFLDFNFSYSTVWLILIWLITFGLPDPTIKSPVQKKPIIIYPILSLFSLVAITNLFLSYRFMEADKFYTEFRQLRPIQLKETAIQKAIAYDPKNVLYRMKASDLNFVIFQHEQEPQYKVRLNEAINSMVSLEPKNSTLLLKAGLISEQSNQFDRALKFYSEGLKNDHYDKRLYENSIRLKVTTAQRIRGTNSEDTHRLLQSAIKDYNQEKQWYNYFLKNAPKEKDRFNSRDFNLTDTSHYYAAIALFEEKKYSKIKGIVKFMHDKNTEKEKVCALDVLSLQRAGESDKAKSLLSEYQKDFPNIAKTINTYKNL